MARDRTLLRPDELTTFLGQHPKWKEEQKALRRTFEFPTFSDGIRFVTRVAEAADAADHHPDIDIRYRKVTLSLSTHDAGGLTSRDTALAAQVERLT
jgi:4a-hydroxytetrahydrobiopterin dehydratase